MCDKIGYVARDYPYRVVWATSIPAVRGRGATRDARDRGSGTHGGSREHIQPVGGRG